MARKGKNLVDVRFLNRALVIDLMRKHNIKSRAELTKHSGLNQATVTNIVSELIDCGLIYETGLIEGKKGRRIIGLDLNCEKYRFLSIRLTREYFLIALYDIKGNQHMLKSVAIDRNDDVGKTLESIKSEIRSLTHTMGDKVLLSTGMAVLGPFLKEEDLFVTATGFPTLKNIHIKKELQNELSIPLYIDHDANLAAYAEWQKCSENGDAGPFLYIMGGQGLGAGIIIDGKIMRGRLGVAGEIGHMSINCAGKKCECGNKGCLEQYASGFAMLNMLKEYIGGYPDTVLRPDSSINDIYDAFYNNDSLATKILDDVAYYLGFGISSLINLINPSTIIIGDDFQKGGPHFLKSVCDSVREHISPDLFGKLNIYISDFKEDPALLGAAILAIDELFKNETFFERLLAFEAR
jgi:predicted NBD/HSP70 family sugar kinase